jgi:hypothetical protein
MFFHRFFIKTFQSSFPCSLLGFRVLESQRFTSFSSNVEEFYFCLVYLLKSLLIQSSLLDWFLNFVEKTYPALFGLARNHYLPENTKIIGYARSSLNQEEFEQRSLSKLEAKSPTEEPILKLFKQRCTYMSGPYDSVQHYVQLRQAIEENERQLAALTLDNEKPVRLFYFALPPTMFETVARALKEASFDECAAVHRLIIEKPFGRDLPSSNELSEKLRHLWTEQQVRLFHTPNERHVIDIDEEWVQSSVLTPVDEWHCLTH